MRKQTLPHIIQHSTILSNLVNKSNNLNKLTGFVRSAVYQLRKTSLAQHCVVAGFEQGILNLLTPSAIWEHELRFLTSELEETLKKTQPFRCLKKIKTRIQETVHEPEVLKLAKPILSHKNAEALLALAEQTQSRALKLALEKLSQNST